MIPQDLHYLFPHAVYLIPVAFFILLLLVLLKAYSRKIMQKYALGKNLQLLLRGESNWIFWLRTLALALSWLFACLALMQPVGNGREVTIAGLAPREGIGKKRKLHDVVFLIDASASMGIKDGRNGSTRLEQAKDIADQILQQFDGDQAALYVFTGDTAQLSPPTFNLFYVRDMIDNISLGEGGSYGTDLKKALELIHNKFIENPKSKLRTIILLSDGGDTRIESLKGSDQSNAVHELADLVKDPHTRLFSIGIGTLKGGAVPDASENGKPVTEVLRPEILKPIADSARGKYYPAYEVSVNDIAADILRITNQDSPFLSQGESITSAQSPIIYDQYFQPPLLIAIILLLIGLLFPNRLKAIASFALVALPSLICADDLHEAAQWYEAGAYKRSIDIYREIGVSSLSPWKEMVVRYNGGTAFTAEGDWGNAQALFRSLPITNNPSPLLERLTQTNLAHMRLGEASSTDDLPRKIYALRQALLHIAKAKEWDCKVSNILGYEKCPTASDLEQMNAITENNLSEALIHVQRYRIDNAGFLNGMPLLLSQVENVLQNIKFLKEKVSDPALQKEYQKVFLYEEETWLPLWERLKERANPPPLFLAARKNYIYSQLLLQHKEFNDAQSYLEEAAKQLKDAMQEEFGSVKEIELLQSLQQSYQLVLLQEPIQLINLVGLLREQQEITRQSGHELGESTKALTQAVAYLTQGNQQGAQVQLEVAYDAMRMYTWQLGTQATPVTILESAIESQEHALNLARLKEGSSSSFDTEQPANAQKQVLEVAATFIPRVVNEQQTEYADKGECLEKPWNTAVPTFYNGLQAARTASVSDNPIRWQEQALTFWKEALKQLKREEPKEEAPQENQMSKLFEELQRMDQMDRQPKAPPIPTLGETKPW